jgi:GT2 family glycosyltransferase
MLGLSVGHLVLDKFNSMNLPQVTVIVTQRERYGYTKTALEHLYQQPSMPFDLIYVDGNSPPGIQQYLQSQVTQRGMQLIRRDDYLPPNCARNLALQKVSTPYVAFLENDVLVNPYWLDHLVACAEQTQAWVVAPLYLEGLPEQGIVHMAGGTLRFKYRGDRKQLFETHHFCKRPLNSVQDKLHRSETEMIEFHCVLGRTEPLKHLNLLDEGLRGLSDHVDLSLMVRQAGGTMYVEPNAIAAYVSTPSLEPSEVPLFLKHWGEWSDESARYFLQKWELGDDDPFVSAQRQWVSRHRLLASKLALPDRLGIKRGGWLNWHIVSRLERILTGL